MQRFLRRGVTSSLQSITLDLMTSIIDGIFKNAPDVTILVAPVIWANKPAMQANTENFNPQVRDPTKQRRSQGKQILPVEIEINTGDISDLKHPNVSGNSKVNPNRRPPLYDASSGSSNRLPSTRKFKKWDGVIFANGTRLEEARSGLYLGCAPTLRKGTKFGNGTVLMSDIPNPRCGREGAQPSTILPTFTTSMGTAVSTFSAAVRIVSTTTSAPVAHSTPGA
ncbi:hypothetical protein ACHAP5_008322 [Fusarium lateritium]